MLPHEKALVERLKDKPFALVGINSDGPADKVAGIEKEHGITWRNAVDGTTSGPIATEWNIKAWPTVFLIDHEGVIRWKGHGMPEDQVEALLVKAVEAAR